MLRLCPGGKTRFDFCEEIHRPRLKTNQARRQLFSGLPGEHFTGCICPETNCQGMDGMVDRVALRLCLPAQQAL